MENAPDRVTYTKRITEENERYYEWHGGLTEDEVSIAENKNNEVLELGKSAVARRKYAIAHLVR